MTVNTFLETWTPQADYIDVGALKTRFSALRGLSNVRPDLTLDQLNQYADNVLIVNKLQYEALVKINPYNTYFETEEHNDHDQHSGEDVNTLDDNATRTTTSTPGVTDTVTTEYGKINDGSFQPTGTRQTDVTDYAFNSTATNQPDQRTTETFGTGTTAYKETTQSKDTGSDKVITTHDGKDQIAQTVDGDVINKFQHGHDIQNDGGYTKSGYVLRDLVELAPEWVNIYDRIVSDIFSVIGSLIATRHIDRSLEW